ncbi:uncharacterized protein LOC123439997 [Hordeum vulgare subsp. vulgare]|uniref:uncharacterized protein LOC123439997 n=1 Tax=Hordeum vulgare subsp. vulgare TaxID=112509 RepID=UPI001D1A3455|nr:uncharacterized protein LOC123439997 [Hordeum vulgare subsp. vulgare]
MFSMPPPLLLARRRLQPSTPRPPPPPPHARHGGHLKPLDSHARVSARRSAVSPRLAAPVSLPNVAKAKICGNSSNMNCLQLRTHQLKVFEDHEDHMITCRGLSEERITNIHAYTCNDIQR